MKNMATSINSYITGFVISLLLTVLSYFIVVGGWKLPLEITVALVICSAVMQLFIQLIFFLHLGSEKGPRWNLLFFISTVGIILLIVLGSLWIMYHLNYNMTPQRMDLRIIHDENMKMYTHTK